MISDFIFNIVEHIMCPYKNDNDWTVFENTGSILLLIGVIILVILLYKCKKNNEFKKQLYYTCYILPPLVAAYISFLTYWYVVLFYIAAFYALLLYIFKTDKGEVKIDNYKILLAKSAAISISASAIVICLLLLCGTSYRFFL